METWQADCTQQQPRPTLITHPRLVWGGHGKQLFNKFHSEWQQSNGTWSDPLPIQLQITCCPALVVCEVLGPQCVQDSVCITEAVELYIMFICCHGNTLYKTIFLWHFVEQCFLQLFGERGIFLWSDPSWFINTLLILGSWSTPASFFNQFHSSTYKQILTAFIS